MRPFFLCAGVVALAFAWFGPLPALAAHRFTAHMTLHMVVVAVAAPLVAIGLAGRRCDPVRRAPALFSAVPASVFELAVVWTWHAPALHHFARGSPVGLIAEQATFLSAGLLVWISALGSEDGQARPRAGAGVVALLLTSMHMTLLGALIGLAPRPLYAHGPLASGAGLLADQQLGGAIMILAGGASYLAGGLWLAAGLLRTPACEGARTPMGPA